MQASSNGTQHSASAVLQPGAHTLFERAAAAASLLAVASLMAGCGLPRKIDSDVQSYVGTPAAVAPATYRFERLPSQQNAADPSQLEALAAAALAKVGLTQTTALPKYSVQVSVNIVRYAPPNREPGMRSMFDMGFRPNGSMFTFMTEPTWYGHTVNLLLRDTTSNQLAFETSARFDGPWSDTQTLLPAILEAALAGYPNPPVGQRKVVVDLPARPQP